MTLLSVSNGMRCRNPKAVQRVSQLSLDVNLTGRQIYINPSMKSEDGAMLEICDSVSRVIPMVLNRQVIKILEDMRAIEECFLELQAKVM